MLMAIQFGQGRIFHTTLGHVGPRDTELADSVNCVGFIATLQRGTEWAATGIRTVAEEGCTVFFSSHLLDEVERVSDQLAMIRNGRIVLNGRLDDIKQNHRQFVVRFEAALAVAPRFETALSLRGTGREWTPLCKGERNHVLAEVRACGATVLSEQIPSLDEIFVAQTAHRPVPNELQSAA